MLFLFGKVPQWSKSGDLLVLWRQGLPPCNEHVLEVIAQLPDKLAKDAGLNALAQYLGRRPVNVAGEPFGRHKPHNALHLGLAQQPQAIRGFDKRAGVDAGVPTS